MRLLFRLFKPPVKTQVITRKRIKTPQSVVLGGHTFGVPKEDIELSEENSNG